MNTFLENFSLPRLNLEEIEIMKNPNASTEVEAVIKKKKSPKKNQNPRTRGLHRRILSII